MQRPTRSLYFTSFRHAAPSEMRAALGNDPLTEFDGAQDASVNRLQANAGIEAGSRIPKASSNDFRIIRRPASIVPRATLSLDAPILKGRIGN